MTTPVTRPPRYPNCSETEPATADINAEPKPAPVKRPMIGTRLIAVAGTRISTLNRNPSAAPIRLQQMNSETMGGSNVGSPKYRDTAQEGQCMTSGFPA